MHENEVAREVVDSAIQIHRELGPGLLESVYDLVMAHELSRRGLKVQQQVPISIVYGSKTFPAAFRADLIVESIVFVEIKSVETLARVHYKQVVTYIRLADLRLGLLINFGEELVKDGIFRIVNKFDDGR